MLPSANMDSPPISDNKMDEPSPSVAESALSKFEDRTRLLNIERHVSCEAKSFLDISLASRSHHYISKHLENVRIEDVPEDVGSPVKGSFSNTPNLNSFDTHLIRTEAWEALKRSLVYYRGQPVGTIAAADHSEDALNYNQVFVRDFIPSGLAFLMNGEPEIVKNFLLTTLRLQLWEKMIDKFKLGAGVMPASFKVLRNPITHREELLADFGSTGDSSLAEMPDCQRGMRLILMLCLSDGFDTFPTLLCADGCCMVDRRMGIYGYPIEIQALFFMALRCALIMLKQDNEGKLFVEPITKRLQALSYHLRTYFWLDFHQLNVIYRYKTEEYSHTAVNKFNVMPDSLPEWVFDFMPNQGGYFIGNVSPARMDFRWFCLGNCLAILSSLATPEQAAAIMDLFEARWTELIGEMPLKVCYPAIEGHDWQITTGCDPKNTRWSYHNGGSWPVLLWLGRYVGKQARKFQTWSIAGYLVAKAMLNDPTHLGMIALEEYQQAQPCLRRSSSC
uniref:Alkaline/neutral invertase n=1 Tax=Ananas comosus var. bracteatus TaxID=296719 RepID=A0A6V7QKB8_ANACO|nr:unnamed protein product [Ananas comosus var. bracteatus]